MRRPSSRAATSPALALAAAGTTWSTTLAWRGFTEAWAAALVPLLVLALAISLTGIALRRARTPGVLVLGAQVVVALLGLSLVVTGSPVPLGEAAATFTRSFGLAVQSSTSYAAPVPAGAPGIEPLLVAGGLACLLAVDLLACTLRVVPLAGLPLLAVYSVPVSILGSGASWWVFALTTAGYLTMLYLDSTDAVTRWGRALVGRGADDGAGPVPDRRPGADPDLGLGVRTGSARGGAGAIGATATALAVVLPLGLPVLHLEVFGGGPGPGGNGEISVDNPMLDLRRDLRRGPDTPLVDVRTDQPDPGYLRISTLTNFTDNEWTSGDRSVPVDQVPDGAMPPLQGLSARVPRETYSYEVSAAEAFRSTWLPTQAPVARVEAEGAWRYDDETMDFIAADPSLTTAGLDYSMTAVVPELDPAVLADAPRTNTQEIDPRFLDLPDLPPVVGDLARRETEGLSSDYEKAVALQTFFRETGGFTYSLDRSDTGNGVDDLVAFLTPGPDGRVGYCEQFAASMAVMARELGIPARVDVGFLRPERQADGSWQYSSRDLHAWPELYFPGAGWVRFEPTPADRTGAAPPYTEQQAAAPAPAPAPSASASARPAPSAGRPTAEQRPQQDTTTAPGQGASAGPPWGRVVGGSGAALALLALAVLPGTLRRRRRERRLHDGAEACWAEVRDTVVDLGLTWPEGRSPRETRDVVVRHLVQVDPDTGRSAVERPRRGPASAVAEAAALDVVVREIEQVRYARRRDPASAVDTAAATLRCLHSLEAGTSTRQRRRARWLPATLWSRRSRSVRSRRRGTDALAG